MSKVAISGAATGTATFTIESPATNTNRTITLPDATGTLALTSAALTGTTDSASPFETSLGTGAGAVTTGVNNTFIGFEAGNDNTTGTNNTAVGFNALDANTTGGSNTALGINALGANTTASNNTAVGSEALAANTTGTNNTAVGYGALDANTTGSINTAIGSGALGSVTTSNDNTALGHLAGEYVTALTTGSQNLLLGAYTRTSASGSTFQYVLGYDVAGQADNNVTIGSASGKIYNAFTVNATWTQTSDERLKRNIQDDTLGLSFVNRLRPVKYQWKPSNEIDPSLPYYKEENNRDTETVMHGLVAQEVKAALDAEGVTTFAGWDVGPDTIQAISREMFVSPLIKAIQELSAQVTALQAEVNTLKGQP